jgi:hypothetical protein
LTPQRLDLTRLRLRLSESEVQGQGHLTLPEQQVELRLNMPRLRLDTLPLACRAAPEATLTAQLVEVQGPSLPPSAIRLEGSYAAQRSAFTVSVTAGP